MIRRFTLSFLVCLATLFPLSAVTAQDTASPSTPVEAGLVELKDLAPDVILDMRYATADNFTGQAVYPSGRCFLRRDVAERVAKAQAELAGMGLGLKVFDCYRPFSVQKRFWKIMPDERYVGKPVEEGGRPVQGSRHNRGAAVDLTVVDKAGNELAMPSGFDDFSDKAARACAACTAEQEKNLRLFERVMTSHGFTGLPSEWWHYDGPGWEAYPLLDVNLPQ